MYDSLYLSIIFGSAIVQKEDQVPNCSRNIVIVVSSLSASSYIIKKKCPPVVKISQLCSLCWGWLKGGKERVYSDEVSTLTYWKSLVLAIEPDCTEPHIVNFVSVTIARTD